MTVTDDLKGYQILLGVSGGIAAYKAAALCSKLTQLNVAVSTVITAHAQRFVAPLTFAALSGCEVFSDLFAAEDQHDPQHISLTERADLIVVAPATANIIAKLAAGICDDLLSTLLCSAASPILLAPAMNQRMWDNPVTQRNVETLKKLDRLFIGPESGRLACGDQGIGRMSEPEQIIQRIRELLAGRKPKAASR